MQSVMRKPKILKSPKKSVPDDLSSLSGLGEKAKIVLNRLGIFYILQISQWSAEEINWIHSHSSGSLSLSKLKNFVEQAKNIQN